MSERYIAVVSTTDNVGTLLRDAEDGEELEIDTTDGIVEVTLEEDIEFGHKVALQPIAAGDTVYKYGKSIGDASEDIEPGEWVHVHNVESNYGRGDLENSAEAEAVSE